jgi:hypothetical protein
LEIPIPKHFRSIESLQKYVRKNGTAHIDFQFILNSEVYTQVFYDQQGCIISYEGMEGTTSIDIVTTNRYDKTKKFNDATIELNEF